MVTATTARPAAPRAPRAPLQQFIRVSAPLLERLLALPQFETISQAVADAAAPGEFAQRVLDHLNVQLDVSDAALQRIPGTGPLVIVVDRTFETFAALTMMATVQRARSDFKLLVERPPAVADPDLIPHIDLAAPHAGLAIGAIRAAIQWLQAGRSLGLFPIRPHLGDGPGAGPNWHPALGRFLIRTNATVVPLHFERPDGSPWPARAWGDPRLQTGWFLRSCAQGNAHPVRVRIGDPVSRRQLLELEIEHAASPYICLRTRLLPNQPAQTAEPAATPQPQRRDHTVEHIRKELNHLPDSRCLVTSGAFRVWIAQGSEIPWTLGEIGRLREWSARSAAPAPATEIDLDPFDVDYLHLVLWDDAAGTIAGGYRLGPTDAVMRARGRTGLYTRALFRYDARFLKALGPAIEVGRSFIAPAYERRATPLILLWRAIGAFAVMRPAYRTLFGPVAIDRRLHDISRQLLASYLTTHHGHADLARWVKPRVPLPRKHMPLNPHLIQEAVRDEATLIELLGHIEGRRSEIPMLIRQHLKLGGRVAAIGLDPEHHDTLHALLVVDLDGAPQAPLQRYMGVEGLQRFKRHAG